VAPVAEGRSSEREKGGGGARRRGGRPGVGDGEGESERQVAAGEGGVGRVMGP
jgi:hypothetical protein